MSYPTLKNSLIVALFVFLSSQLSAQNLYSAAAYVYSFNVGTSAVDTMGAFALSTCYQPKGRLVHIGNGELIGITEQSVNLYGAIYKTDTITGGITVLCEFTNNDRPQSSLVLANNGKLYYLGSTNTANESRIYSFDLSTNTYTNEYEITGNAGSGIFGGMVKASNGLLYGVTQRGGANDKGVIFSFNTTNNTYTPLYDFTQMDGANPGGSMIQVANGKLYGNTTYGGVNDKGVIFSFDLASNTYTKLFDFVQSTGECPTSPMFQASDGRLYGVTMAGGTYFQGVLYSFDIQSGNYSALHHFFASDGYGPRTTPTEVEPNVLYGNTNQGGANFRGSIYSYNTLSNMYQKWFDGSDSTVGNFTVPFYNFNEPAVGIAEVDVSEREVVLYPNPCNDIMYIDRTVSGSYLIINTLGQTVGEGILNGTTLMLEGIPSGLYTLIIRNSAEETLCTKKFVKR